MSEIEMKIKEKTKELDECKEMLVHNLKNHLEQGVEAANAVEIGTVADAINDLAEATEKCVKTMYHQQLMEAMKEKEYGEDYDEEGPLRGYRGRSARTGRFVHRGYEERIMRDMDREDGRMYYAGSSAGGGMSTGGTSTSGGYNRGYEDGHARGYQEGHDRGYEEGRSRGYREAGTANRSRYDNARRGFDDTHKEDAAADHEQKMQALQEMLSSMTEELEPKILKMNPQEKQYTKNTLQALINRI